MSVHSPREPTPSTSTALRNADWCWEIRQWGFKFHSRKRMNLSHSIHCTALSGAGTWTCVLQQRFQQRGLKPKAFLFDLQLTRKFNWAILPIPQASGLIVSGTLSSYPQPGSTPSVQMEYWLCFQGHPLCMYACVHTGTRVRAHGAAGSYPGRRRFLRVYIITSAPECGPPQTNMHKKG